MVRASRRAFSLIELLVVIAIIAVLMSLLMAGVQQARAAASRVACANNLHQIALAFHNHHDALNLLPDAGGGTWTLRTMVNGAPENAPNQEWCWTYQILPYLDQESLWSTPDEWAVRATPVKLYFCPSRRAPEVHLNYHNVNVAMLDYAGNGGTDQGVGPPWAGGSPGGPGDSTDGMLLWHQGIATPNYPGPLALNEGSVPDGLSNTMLVGEKSLSIAGRGHDQGDDNEGYVAGYDDDTIRWAIAQPRKDPVGTHNSWAFGSSHHSSFNAAFADGSVQHIRYTIDLAVLRKVCSRNDGQSFSPGDL